MHRTASRCLWLKTWQNMSFWHLVYWNDTKTIVFALMFEISAPSSQACVQKTCVKKTGDHKAGAQKAKARKTRSWLQKVCEYFREMKTHIKHIEFSLFFFCAPNLAQNRQPLSFAKNLIKHMVLGTLCIGTTQKPLFLHSF